MSLFPLYDEIKKQMTGAEKCLSRTECASITRLDQEHINIIYLIILHHYIQNHPDKVGNIPYNGRIINKGRGVFYKNLAKFPKEVQKIISKYLCIINS